MTHTAQTWEKTVKENKHSWNGRGVFNTLVFELLVTKHGMEFTLKPFLKTALFIKDKNNSWKERTYCKHVLFTPLHIFAKSAKHSVLDTFTWDGN